MTMLSAILLLILVFDPAGNMLTFVSVMKDVKPHRHRFVIAREMLIALGIMLVFLFVGRAMLGMLRIEEPSLSIAGGIVLFLIALRMVFPTPEGVFGDAHEGEPLVVPLATPLVAGPSAIATVILLMTRDPGRWLEWLGALVIAWAFSAGILVFAGTLCRLLGSRILTAVQRLMGMVLVTLSVQMLVMGVRAFIQTEPLH